MSGRGKVTLADVAEKSGFSLATVSMILGGRTDMAFAPQTVTQVREAAASLGYAAPRRSRGRLGAGRVLIICPNVGNPYYATMIQAIQQGAAAAGLSTLIETTYRDRAAEERLLDEAARSDLAGLIFTMLPQCVELAERVSRLKPLVVIGDRTISLNVDTVELNNYEAGLALGRHMTGLGHRHAAYLSTPLNAANSARVRRLEGVEAAFAEVGGQVLVKTVDVTPATELGNISIEHAVGRDLARQCLEVPGLTALMAVNDMVAYGVLDAVAEAGKRVPEEYSVCGFDNIFPSGFLSVGLTTVEHHLVEKSRNAFEILRGRIFGSTPASSVTRVEYSHHLVLRASTGPARTTGVAPTGSREREHRIDIPHPDPCGDSPRPALCSGRKMEEGR
ncbi:LacI family DNA-binding transcriptional regulator [uncultured Desulfovibrio sp.]|uniref:LacI family DNA-binding transcriptional regulator n=2 Tax=uncultured Desulfovibrio sp. TaxID=167968 RepID=UPI0025DED3CE|nr:LacI family DNA-binding transcriptional regulator [uncultured Desulfovibrio sp.]